jgi:hypothetical protein
MPDDLYAKILKHINYRLIHSSRSVTVLTLLFTLFTTIAGFLSIQTNPNGIMNGVIYWTIFIWSLVLFGSLSFMYSRSGARKQLRERYIQEEVLDFGDPYQLNQDEMIDLHLQLSHDIELQSRPFGRLLMIAAGNLLLWPGMLVFMLVIQHSTLNFTEIFRDGLIFSLIGSLLLGFAIPLRQIFAKQIDADVTQDVYNDLRGIYGYKRKRDSLKNDVTAPRTVGDDGELVLRPENNYKQNRQHGA